MNTNHCIRLAEVFVMTATYIGRVDILRDNHAN